MRQQSHQLSVTVLQYTSTGNAPRTVTTSAIPLFVHDLPMIAKTRAWLFEVRVRSMHDPASSCAEPPAPPWLSSASVASLAGNQGLLASLGAPLGGLKKVGRPAKHGLTVNKPNRLWSGKADQEGVYKTQVASKTECLCQS